MKLKLKLSPAALLGAAQKAKPYVIGLVLVGAFGYAAYVVNLAVNVQPAPQKEAPKKVTFDKATLTTIKNLDYVSGQVPSGGIGKDNPFSR